MDTISKTSLRAHNSGKAFPVMNENYNLMHKLGKAEERLFLEGLSEDEYGMNTKHAKITDRILKENGITVLNT